MEINLKNCGNIKEGKIAIEEGTLNIKYAINGTGKSTIARVILYEKEINEDNKKNLEELLLPYENIDDKNIEISGLENIEKVSIFNDDYVKQYVFKKDEIIENSFSIFIENNDYKKGILEIEELIKDLKNIFQNDENLDKLILDTDNFFNSIKIKNSGDIDNRSTIIKGLEGVKKINHPPEGLEDYQEYLKNTEFNSKYIAWQQQGQTYLNFNDKKCPCCVNEIKQERKNKIEKFSTEYKKAEIDNLNKILEVIDGLEQYFNKSTKETINSIKNNISGITDEQKSFLIKLREEIKGFNIKLKKLKELNFFNLKEIDDIDTEINKFKFNLDNDLLYSYINSVFTKEKIKPINDNLDKLISDLIQLKQKIGRQKSLLRSIINKYKNNINEFLKSSGYKYEIDIVEEKEKYRFILKPLNSDIELKNSIKNLSYGEKNAFALVLFMFQALKEKSDLIILDDPISSFDQNKKFAILNMLFGSLGENFKGKTVLMLTHDFDPVINIIKNNLPGNLGDNKNAYFLENINGILKEKEIIKDDIKSFNQICIENLQNNIHNINKCIFLRRKFEIEDDKGLEYELLSNIIHKKEIPQIKNSRDSYRNMTEQEIEIAYTNIKKFISDFNYRELLNIINDNNELKEIYNNSGSNYEKFQIYRILKDNGQRVNIQDKIIKKFIDESFHVENDYLFQLNPTKYELVPNYIINICNSDL